MEKCKCTEKCLYVPYPLKSPYIYFFDSLPYQNNINFINGDTIILKSSCEIYIYKNGQWIYDGSLKCNTCSSGKSPIYFITDEIQTSFPNNPSPGDIVIFSPYGYIYSFDGLKWVYQTNVGILSTSYLCENENKISMGMKIYNGNIDNIDYVSQPVGTGSNLAQFPDGEISGGECRGDYSTDFQKLRTIIDKVAKGYGSGILSGKDNKTQGEYSSIVSGNSNLSEGKNSSVLSGNNNLSRGDNSFVGSGQNNRSIGLNSFVTSGESNISTGDHSFILNGNNNNSRAPDSFITNGNENNIDELSILSNIISSKLSNIFNSKTSSIDLSENSVMNTSNSSFIKSSFSSTIENSDYSFILSSYQSKIENSNISSIKSGLNDLISPHGKEYQGYKLLSISEEFSVTSIVKFIVDNNSVVYLYLRLDLFVHSNSTRGYDETYIKLSPSGLNQFSGSVSSERYLYGNTTTGYRYSIDYITINLNTNPPKIIINIKVFSPMDVTGIEVTDTFSTELLPDIDMVNNTISDGNNNIIRKSSHSHILNGDNNFIGPIQHRNNTLLGDGLVSISNDCIIVGQYNEIENVLYPLRTSKVIGVMDDLNCGTINPTEIVFCVSYGTSDDNRKNLFVVNKNGDVWIRGSLFTSCGVSEV